MTSELVHCVYASSAARDFDPGELAALLAVARANNARLGLTGVLLYAEGSFFQVLEGSADVVDAVYARIERDPRHHRVTMIIKEPIPRRYFDTWTMGFHNVSREELAEMAGTNDFFGQDRAVGGVDAAGRARKLLAAFRDGRWRRKVVGDRRVALTDRRQRRVDARLPPAVAGGDLHDAGIAGAPAFSYAFQPIVDVVAREVFSYEALIRGPANEPAFGILQGVPAHAKYAFDEHSRVAAVALAMRLGARCHLNLNLLPQGLYVSETAVTSTLAAAARHGLPADRIVLEVTEGEVIADYAHLGQQLNEFRSLGLKVAIDDFGAGYSGLNMLAAFQPDQIKIDMNLVRGIERHGPRQAIVRAVVQVCDDLGIDVIAEGVESPQEYAWFAERGVRLFQGYLFARPGFECLPPAHFPAGDDAGAPPPSPSR